DLSVVYVIDMPQGMRMVSEDDLKTLGLDRDRLRTTARANLLAAVPDVPMVPVEATGLWTNEKGDDYDSSFLVFVERRKALAASRGGRLWMGAPSRNRLFAVGGGAPDRIAALKAATDRAFSEEHHPLSRALLEWSPEGWKVHPER